MEKAYEEGRDRRLSFGFYNFSSKNSIKCLKSFDDYAKREIKEAQNYIKALSEYRKDLFKHVQFLETAKSHLELHYYRRKLWEGPVHYHVKLCKVYSDSIENEDLISESWSGKERSIAKKRYNELLKKYPGVICKIDLEKNRGRGKGKGKAKCEN